MADNDFILSLFVNDEQALRSLAAFPGAVDRAAMEANLALERMGASGVTGFGQRILEQAQAGLVGISEVVAAANAGSLSLRRFSEASAGTPGFLNQPRDLGGQVAQTKAMVEALQQQAVAMARVAEAEKRATAEAAQRSSVTASSGRSPVDQLAYIDKGARVGDSAGLPDASLTAYLRGLGFAADEAAAHLAAYRAQLRGAAVDQERFKRGERYTDPRLEALEAQGLNYLGQPKQNAVIDASPRRGALAASDLEPGLLGARIGVFAETNAVLREGESTLVRYNRLLAASASAEGRLAEAKIATTRAELAKNRLLNNPNATDEQLLGVGQRLMSAQRRQRDLQAAQTGGSGFFGGVFHGLTTGSRGESGEENILSEGSGRQIGQLGRYYLLYQTFRLVQQAIQSSVEEMLKFDRGVTELAEGLEMSHDSARGLANELGTIGSLGGMSPGDTVSAAARFAQRFAGEAAPEEIARAGAKYGTQLAVLTGQDGVKELDQASAVVRAFNLSFSDTPRVMDAATFAARRFGLATAGEVLPGLGQIADLAQEAGFSIEEAALSIAAIQARTGESSEMVAGGLRRVLGREGNPAFQEVFAKTGVDTTATFRDQLLELSSMFGSFSAKEKAFIVGQFGGGRAGNEALAFIESYAQVMGLAEEALDNAGIAQEEFFGRLNDLRGIVTQIGGLFKELAKDVGETGIASGFGLALSAAIPLLRTLDDILKVINQITTLGGLIPESFRNAAVGAAEIAGVVALIQKVRGSGVDGPGGGQGILGRLNPFGKGGDDDTGPIGAAGTKAAAGVALAGQELIATTSATTAGIAIAGGVRTEVELVGATSIGAADAVEARTRLVGAELVEQSMAIEAELRRAQAEGPIRGGDGFRAGLNRLGNRVPGLEKNAFANAGAGTAALAVVGAVVIDKVLNASIAISQATKKSENLNLSGSTADELRSNASELANAAKEARQSSSGFFGTLTNAAKQAFGGDGTGGVARRNDELARVAKFEAEALKKAQDEAAAVSPANVIDLSSQETIASSYKLLQERGLDATTQLAVLIEKLQNFAEASAGAANTLAKGQYILSAQKIANAATNDFQAFTDIDRTTPGDFAKQAVAAAVGKADLTELNAAIAVATADYYKSQGLDQGGPISKDQQKELEAESGRAAIANLEAQGTPVTDEVRKNLELAIHTAVKNDIKVLNALAGKKLSPGEVAEILKISAELTKAAGAEAQAIASLGGDARGGALAGAEASLAAGRKILESIQNSVHSDRELLQAEADIRVLELNVQSALIAHIQVLGKLAESLISPFDKGGRLASQIDTAREVIATATDADTEAQAQAQLNELLFQQRQDAVTTAAAFRTKDLRPGQAVGAADAALENASEQLGFVEAEGGTETAAYASAYKAYVDAFVSLILAQVEQANALAASLVDPRDDVGQARGALDAAVAVLEATNQLDSNGVQTAEYSQLLTDVRAKEIALAQAELDKANAFKAAALDPRNTIGSLLQQIDAVTSQLAIDLEDTKKFAEGQKRLKELQQQLADAQRELAHSIRLARVDVRDTVGEATETLRAAKEKLAGDLKGTKEYYDDLRAVYAATLALAQAQVELGNARRDSGVRPGNELEAARAAILSAEDEIRLTKKGSLGYYQALKTLNEAKYALAQAEQAQAATLDLLGGDITDPLFKALADVRVAQRKLDDDTKNKTGNLDDDKLALVSAQQAAQAAAFDQQLSDTQVAHDLGRLSDEAFLSFLQGQHNSLTNQLAAMKKGEQGYRQLVDELNQVDALIKSTSESLENQFQGQFNLGDIDVPTVYQVRAAVAGGQNGLSGGIVTINNNVEINGADMSAVVAYLNSLLGPGAAERNATQPRRLG